MTLIYFWEKSAKSALKEAALSTSFNKKFLALPSSADVQYPLINPLVGIQILVGGHDIL